MQLLLIKLVLTPLLMLIVSWAARRWGPGIGGLLVGLPLASGPISIYLCAEQGANFAASAAGHSILSLTPVALFSVVYAVVAQRLSMPACLLSGFGVFLLVLYFLQSLALSLWQAWIIGVLVISIGLIVVPNKLPVKFQIRYPRWDLPARILCAIAMVFLITLSASVLGPRWSGLLSPIPIIAWPLCAFVHGQQGSEEARLVLRGILEGAFGVMIFYTVIAGGLSFIHPVLAYGIAIFAALFVSLPWLKGKVVVPAE
jgi:uncharacterized integral membrane protein